MRPVVAVALAVSIPGAFAWGGLGHITTAFVASRFVSNSTEAYLKTLLDDPTDAYLAGVATWADNVKYTEWGRFSRTFHFIDAKDHPPESCNVDLARDCKPSGCVVSALTNYTRQSLDGGLAARDRAVAAKFVVHLVGDAHQPLHDEDVARGGNGIPVLWQGRRYSLHGVWDGKIAEKWIGGRRGSPYAQARRWADELVAEISAGKFAGRREAWRKGLDIADPDATAMVWVREANSFVCTTVLPDGPEAIRGRELSEGPYYEKAGPAVEQLVAQGGYRLAAWLDLMVDEYLARSVMAGPRVSGGEL